MPCNIEGVIIRSLEVHTDSRGWLCELFRHDVLEEINFPVMGYASMTRAGKARGPHEHREQSDCFAFIGPSSFQVFLWDNRKDSPSHLEKFTDVFGASNPAQLIIPPGVVHVYKNTGNEDGIVYNFPNRLYRGEGSAGPVDEVRYEDEMENRFNLDDF